MIIFDKILYPVLFLKALLSFFLTYNLLNNIETNSFLNTIGNIFTLNNYTFGASILITITVISLIFTIICFIKLKKGTARRYLLNSNLLDITLITFCFYFGLQILFGSGYPMEEAFLSIISSLIGMAILLYFVNFIILIPYCIISKRGD